MLLGGITMGGKVSGIFAPITTPFVNEEVSLEHLKENVRKYRETPLSGFLVLGSNGENKSLTDEEKLSVLETVIREKADSQIVMAGTGYESTRQTIAFSKKAQEIGADIVSLLTPSYFKKSLTDDALIGYYTDVADAVNVPVFVYNAPGFTGVTLSPRVIEVVSRHPNIGGMKDTSPAGIAHYLEVCSPDFDVLAGTINTLFIGLSLGASGGVVSLANAFPEPCCKLYEKFMQGNVRGARELHSKLFRLNQSVSGAGGVAGVKQAMDFAGYYGGPPRLPLLPLSDAKKQLVKDAIEKAELG
ncbi:MAG: dihydrodipicolinate synthase family protein [Deltaproteobacteria bacterium]|nr:MAG: dihydrodipicolinate synthase family protein [Deltaproteobacteria bacterium]